MSTPDKGESSDPADSSNMRWQFIDASNNSRSNLTQVKRHVMQEYMRQKKGNSRNSESEEDNGPQKRGRPKKTRGAKRKAAKDATAKDKDSAHHNLSNNKHAPPLEKDAPADIEEVVRDWQPGVSAPSGFSAVTLPFRTSPIQSLRSPGLGSISPQSQSQLWDLGSVSSWSSTPQTPLDFVRSPKTLLSAARTDPFNSLPIELDLEGQKLFDFYVNDMPACSYGTHFRSQKAHNWYTQVFVPEGMKGAVAFQNTILVHAANTWAWVRNETETSTTLVHRDRAVSMLRDHLSKNPRDNSDVAIISCLSAAALEDFDPRPGHKEISWVHMRAAREMIRSRGGPDAFANTRLGMLINWQDYILSGYETHGPSFFFEKEASHSIPLPEPPASSRSSENIQSMPSPPHSISSALSDISPCPEPSFAVVPTPNISPIDEIRLQCEEFLHFLRRCEQLALYQRDNPKACHIARYTTVHETSLLFQILAAPPGARFTSSGDRKQMVARLTALIMLNAALWDYRYSSVHTGSFLQTLEEAMVDSEVSMSGSVEAILQILLECNDGSPSEWVAGEGGAVSPILAEQAPNFEQYSPTATSPFARPWFAGRMLKICKRLGPESWHRISDFLFTCLTLRVFQPSVYLWEADLRQEVLDAPLTSYIMPSLIG
ncbi:hypothetical protein N7462_009813 [Penicillium macrosclerotiorum]|uniref:uncharacterized protein n=1 Tax=Penicillium macrosclerotiorum TaxID=303699 RepID=UPI002547DBA9|nr:uncharacterized protein N7462_009813 [Penicillium macrosclerotiorum]KAJ5668743.1 hypothetical protein N7462_009813 [Penicillium macrosclerotiorum]